MIDDALEMGTGEVVSAEICIAGAGASGITLALELAASGLTVLLLESGGMKAETQTQRLYEGEVADERLHSLPHRYRQRRFGGSTTIWGGRCVPFDEIDFEARDYIPGSGWPIDLATLLPFYPRANELCEAGDFQYRAAEAFQRPLPPMIEGFRSDHFSTDSLERFSCPTDFGARYGEQLRNAANVRVLLHANVTTIKFHPNGEAVESVLVRTLTGKQFTVRASCFVLAAGGLEVARLLLANRDTWPHGIGNDHDVVGRYYMCHIAGTVGTLKQSGGTDRVRHGYDVTGDGIYCRRRIALTAQTQRQLQIGNFIGRLHHPRITDPAHRTAVLSALQLAKGLISYEYGKRLHGEERTSMRTWMTHMGNVLRGPHEVLAFGHHMLRDRILAKRKFPSIIVKSTAGHYSLDFHAEQEPSASSRVNITMQRDELGLARLLVDWCYTQGDVQTVRKAVQLFAQDIAQSGIGVFEYDPHTIELEMSRYGAYGGHHLGTARMGADRRTSVVNSDCRIHGVRNLYVAGGAVFPTSSQANPTLTIVALALRLANHLRVAAEGRDASKVRATANEPSDQLLRASP
ncbi:MAG: family oxidoreductase [Gammaproteobacteria bacterium]|nr:family oxidoreductase [Gammaproteobacteria bacterium]